MQPLAYLIVPFVTSCVLGCGEAAAQPPSSISPADAAAATARQLSEARRTTLRAAAEAGNPDLPQRVERSEIPSLDELRQRFAAVRTHLKPEFLARHSPGRANAVLAQYHCKSEADLPSGFETTPHQLDGVIVLFACADGKYGRLSISLPPPPGGRVSATLLPEAINSKVLSYPAVGRFRMSGDGTFQSIWRWNTPTDEFTLELITPASSAAAEPAMPKPREEAGHANGMAAKLSTMGKSTRPVAASAP